MRVRAGGFTNVLFVLLQDLTPVQFLSNVGRHSPENGGHRCPKQNS